MWEIKNTHIVTEYRCTREIFLTEVKKSSITNPFYNFFLVKMDDWLRLEIRKLIKCSKKEKIIPVVSGSRSLKFYVKNVEITPSYYEIRFVSLEKSGGYSITKKINSIREAFEEFLVEKHEMILKEHSEYIHILEGNSSEITICLFQDYFLTTSRFQRGGFVEPPHPAEVLMDDNPAPIYYSNLGYTLWASVNTINRMADDKFFPILPYTESMKVFQNIIKAFNNLRSLECLQMNSFIERCKEEEKTGETHYKDINARMRVMLGPKSSFYPTEEDKIRSYWKFFRSEPRKSRRFDEVNVEFPRMLFDSNYEEKYVKLFIKDLIEGNVIAVSRTFTKTNPDIKILWTGGEALRNYITEPMEYFTTDYDIKVLIGENLPQTVRKIEQEFMVHLRNVLNENFGAFRIGTTGTIVMKEADTGYTIGLRFKDGDHILNIIGFKYFSLEKVAGRDFLMRFNVLYTIDTEIRDEPLLDVTIMNTSDHPDGIAPFFEIRKPEYEIIGLNDDDRERIGKQPSKEDYHNFRRGRRLGYFAIPTEYESVDGINFAKLGWLIWNTVELLNISYDLPDGTFEVETEGVIEDKEAKEKRDKMTKYPAKYKQILEALVYPEKFFECGNFATLLEKCNE
jgi:hypothetical protein